MIASRWAWLGACANPGAAVANVAAANNAQSFAARFNVLIICINPFVVAGAAASTELNYVQTGEKTFAADIILAFRFHCKRIVAIHGSRTFSNEKPFPEANFIEARK
ncbi:hypothetical protein [Bradyrhizobium sp. Ash2021]|uniref:hypothetical protein n=1 Tax=Bradyrhizobium sp. Ash2021 TaxID=2954771 RepID=UPI00281630E4|nr:hypothetical protein [Bradyrhizobium sp. Ash2021]WMT79365.1 hypothetical protein NL528_43010 [Bradyrhizobium sp. Ash2021]